VKETYNANGYQLIASNIVDYTFSSSVASPNDYAIFETHDPWGYTIVKDAIAADRYTYASGTSHPETARSIRSSGRCLLTLH
jgi:hypothetical protein